MEKIRLRSTSELKSVPFKIREIHPDQNMMFNAVLSDDDGRNIVVPLDSAQSTHLLYHSAEFPVKGFYLTPYQQVLMIIEKMGGNVIDITVVKDIFGTPFAQLTWKIEDLIQSMPIPAGDALIYSALTEIDLKFMNNYIEKKYRPKV